MKTFLFLLLFLVPIYAQTSQNNSGDSSTLNKDKQRLSFYRSNRSVDIAYQLLPIEDRISKLECIDSLNKRLKLLEDSKHSTRYSWWDKIGNFVLSTGFITALISLIIGFFKWILAKDRFEHERHLSLLEHQNKWRNEYLSKALDSKLDLSIRMQFLRFLTGTSKDDTAIADWAKQEIDIYKKAQENQALYAEKKAQLTDIQSSVPRIRDIKTKELQSNKIINIEGELLTIKKTLSQDGFQPIEL